MSPLRGTSPIIQTQGSSAVTPACNPTLTGGAQAALTVPPNTGYTIFDYFNRTTTPSTPGAVGSVCTGLGKSTADGNWLYASNQVGSQSVSCNGSYATFSGDTTDAEYMINSGLFTRGVRMHAVVRCNFSSGQGGQFCFNWGPSGQSYFSESVVFDWVATNLGNFSNVPQGSFGTNGSIFVEDTYFGAMSEAAPGGVGIPANVWVNLAAEMQLPTNTALDNGYVVGKYWTVGSPEPPWQCRTSIALAYAHTAPLPIPDMPNLILEIVCRTGATIDLAYIEYSAPQGGFAGNRVALHNNTQVGSSNNPVPFDIDVLDAGGFAFSSPPVGTGRTATPSAPQIPLGMDGLYDVATGITFDYNTASGLSNVQVEISDVLAALTIGDDVHSIADISVISSYGAPWGVCAVQRAWPLQSGSTVQTIISYNTSGPAPTLGGSNDASGAGAWAWLTLHRVADLPTLTETFAKNVTSGWGIGPLGVWAAGNPAFGTASVSGNTGYLSFVPQGSGAATVSISNFPNTWSRGGQFIVSQNGTHFVHAVEVNMDSGSSAHGYEGIILLGMGTAASTATDFRNRGNCIQLYDSTGGWTKAAYTWGTGQHHVKWQLSPGTTTIEIGLANVKVWPVGSPEPANWTLTVGQSPWAYLRAFGVLDVGATDGGYLPGTVDGPAGTYAAVTTAWQDITLGDQ